MANKKVDFLTPVARILQGDPFEPQTTDQQGNRLKIKSGPRMGQDTQSYVLILGVPKNDPEFGPFYAQLDALARESWPQFFNGAPGPDGRPTCTNPNMSLKIMDGDGVDGYGKPNNTKEGFAGCWIIKTKSSFPPKIYYKDHYQPHEEIKDRNLVKRGYWVRVGGSMESNSNVQKPGLYLNLGQVALWGIGPEILSGPSAAQVFGAATAGNMPAGMQALPAMPAVGGGMPSMPGINQPAMGGMPGMPMQSPGGMVPQGMPPGGPLAMPGAMPMGQQVPTLPGGMPGFAPGAGMPGAVGMPAQPQQQPVFVQPNPGILAGPGGAMPGAPAMGGMPGMPGMPPMQPAAPQLTAKGVQSGYTYEQYKAGGYSDEVLRANGLIA